jgi:hypothetical protein
MVEKMFVFLGWLSVLIPLTSIMLSLKSQTLIILLEPFESHLIIGGRIIDCFLMIILCNTHYNRI